MVVDRMGDFDPFDELGVSPGASPEEVDRAYKRRIVERHRRGVWKIVAHFRRAQRALAAVTDPEERRHQQRERQRRIDERAEDQGTRQGRQLALLRSYKQRMHRDLERLGAANAQENAAELAEIERQLELEERRAQELTRRRRLVATVRSVVLLALFVAAGLGFWLER